MLQREWEWRVEVGGTQVGGRKGSEGVRSYTVGSLLILFVDQVFRDQDWRWCTIGAISFWRTLQFSPFITNPGALTIGQNVEILKSTILRFVSGPKKKFTRILASDLDVSRQGASKSF